MIETFKLTLFQTNSADCLWSMAAEVAVLTAEPISLTTQDHFSESPIETHPPLPIQSIVEDEQEEPTQDNMIKTEEVTVPVSHQPMVNDANVTAESNATQIEPKPEPTEQAIQLKQEETKQEETKQEENKNDDASEPKQENEDIALPPPPPLEEFEQAQETYPTPPPAPSIKVSEAQIQRVMMPMSLKSRTNSSKNSRKYRNNTKSLGSNIGEVFECPDCDKAYASESRLRRHKLYHLDISERPFQCEFCIWSFVQQSELKRHLKRKHPSKQITQPITPRYRIGDTHDPNLPPSLRLSSSSSSSSSLSSSSSSNNSNLHRMPHSNMVNMPTLSDPSSISQSMLQPIPPSIDPNVSMNNVAITAMTDPGDTTTTTTVDEENNNNSNNREIEEIIIEDQVNMEQLPVPPPAKPEIIQVDEGEEEDQDDDIENNNNHNKPRRRSRKRKRQEIIEQNDNDNDNDNDKKRKSKRSNKRQKYDKFFVDYDEYRCKFCGNLFSTTQSLIDHERIHTAAKPYTCKYCMKGFKKKEEWQQHQSAHTFLD